VWWRWRGLIIRCFWSTGAKCQLIETKPVQ
jgi:hypothetical protein